MLTRRTLVAGAALGVPLAMPHVARAQKAKPQADVVMMDVSVAKAASDEGLFEPVTAAQMPVPKQLNPRAFTPGVHAPAVTFDNLVLMDSPQKVQPAPTSWKVFWDPTYSGTPRTRTGWPLPACPTSSASAS